MQAKLTEDEQTLVVAEEAFSLLLEGVALMNAILKFRKSQITAGELFVTIGNIGMRLFKKYIKTSQDDSLAKAYKVLSLENGSKDRDKIEKKYQELESITSWQKKISKFKIKNSSKIHHKGGRNDNFVEIKLAKELILSELDKS